MFNQCPIHANFSVDDLSVAKGFYCDKLGFELIREEQGQMLLQAGAGTKINIYQKDDHTPWDSTVLGIEVEDVKLSVEQLESIGVSTAKIEGSDDAGIMSHPEMGEAAWVQDPAKNWICISHSVH